MPDGWTLVQSAAAASPDGWTLVQPRRPVSAEDFAPQQRDVSVGNMLWNAAKSIPAGVIDTAKTLYTDSRPEDASLGPAGVLAPLVRAAGAGAMSEARKATGAQSGLEAAGHAAAAVLPLVGPAAAQAGEDLGSGETARIERGGGNAIGLVGGMLAPGTVAKVAPKVAPALATIGEQLASKGRAVASRVGPVATEAAKTAPVELAAHYLGAPLGSGAIARVLFRAAMDSIKKTAPAAEAVELPPIPANAGQFPLKPVNAGGAIVRDAAGRPIRVANSEQAMANALAETRQTAPELPQSVELPPQAELPPGYAPRTEAPPVVAPANAGGRLAPPQTPTTTQALTEAIAQARVPEPPARVTTAPEPSLPPGYTPRSTVPKPTATPKPRAAKADLPEPVKQAIAAGERKRAYFLKPVEEMAAEAESAAAPRVAPSGSLTKADLPTSWRSHTGQDIFPLTGDEGKAVVAALRDELKARGLSIGQARMEVSKNRSLPTEVRAQLLRALEQSGKAK